MKFFKSVVALLVLVLLTGCAAQMRQFSSVSSPQAPRLEPTACMQDRELDIGAGWVIYSVVRFTNDTPVAFKVNGPGGQNYVVCPNGGFVDISLRHFLTDASFRGYSVNYSSLGTGHSRVGIWTQSVGGSSGYRYDIRASSASQVY